MPAMRIDWGEVFGPVASVIEVQDYAEALEVANDTPFGLPAGTVMVNTATAGVDYHVPFGGRQGSSCGPREYGTHVHEFYTVVNTAYVYPRM